MSPASAPYLTIVLTGRNDDFGRGFTARLLCALEYNHARLTAAGVPYDVVFVEWRPVAGKPLLADELRRALPQLDEHLITFEVDARYHEAYSQNPRLQFHEFVAKNVGIRRAAGSFILSTNTDICLDGRTISTLAGRELQPGTLYRATRIDLKQGIDLAHLAEDVFLDRRNWVSVNAIKPPEFTNASGDFLLLDRASWQTMRGFNEVYRVAKIHIDANFCYRARAAGLPLVDTGAHAYHLGPGTLLSRRKAYLAKPAAAPWGADWHKEVLCSNPPGWGIAEAPVTARSLRDFRLEFDPSALPPLVSLHGVGGVLRAPRADRFARISARIRTAVGR